MSDATPTFDLKPAVAEARSTDGSTRALRSIGYCAGCGTWDEHGPTCIACGYDFSGGQASLPLD